MRFAARSLGKSAVAHAVTKVLRRRREVIPPHDSQGPVAQPAAAPETAMTLVMMNQVNGGAFEDVNITPASGHTITGNTDLRLSAVDADTQANVTITRNGVPQVWGVDIFPVNWPNGFRPAGLWNIGDVLVITSPYSV